MALNQDKSGVEHGDQMKIKWDSPSKSVDKNEMMRLQKDFCR